MRTSMILLNLVMGLGLALLAPEPGVAWEPKLDSELVVRVRVEAVSDGGLVRLRDVASPVGEGAALWRELRNTVVSARGSRWVTRGKIQRRLRGMGVPTGAVQVRGAAVCVVRVEKKKEQ